MKITKAIEMLSLANTFKPTSEYHVLKDAMKLGIEALKREEKRRRFAIPDKVNLLPGED